MGAPAYAGSLNRSGGPSAPVSATAPETSLRHLTPAAAAELDGPAWLRARRVAAAEQASSSSTPSTEEEVWRYSRIDDLDLDRYAPAAVRVEVDGAGAQGVRVRRGAELDPGGPGPGSVAGAPVDLFGALADAFADDPLVVEVAPGTVVADPVVVRVEGPGSSAATFPRLVVQVGAGAQVTVVEHHAGGADGITVPVTELAVGPGAHLGHLVVQDLSTDAWSLGRLVAQADQDATVVAGTAAFGGGYARVRTDCRLTGRGATGRLLAAYFGDGHQMLDFRTFQEHLAPDTTSDLLFKGALAASSRSVYTGLIHVDRVARGTDATQTNRNLKLSDQAWAESVPNLEIENNDVRCSHASTVAPIDPEQRFYLESRGVPTAVAERLIVTGFFDEVLERLPAPGRRAGLRRRVADKLVAGGLG